MNAELPSNEQLQTSIELQYEEKPTSLEKGFSFEQYIGAGLLIGVGTLLLGQTMGMLDLAFLLSGNKWALFFLLPVVGGLSRIARDTRRKSLAVAIRRHLGGVLFMSTIFSFLYFGISWSEYWPLLLIVVGVSSIISR